MLGLFDSAVDRIAQPDGDTSGIDILVGYGVPLPAADVTTTGEALAGSVGHTVELVAEIETNVDAAGAAQGTCFS